MAKYMILSDSPFLPTGFRNQSFLLAEHLANDGHDVYWIAPSHAGVAIKNAKLPDGRECPFTVLPGGRHQHALDVLPYHLDTVQPHYFFTLLDSFMLYPQIVDLNLNAQSSTWLPWRSALWYPSDGGYFPLHCEQVLRKFDRVVAMSKWGQQQVQSLYNIPTDYIPHGIMMDNFHPVKDKAALRAKYSKLFGRNLHGSFIVGCVARNQPRKNMDRLIKAFTLFAKDKPNALLLLHSDPNDPAQYNLKVTDLIQRCGIGNKVVWTGMQAHTGWPDSLMHEIYNLFDVKFDTTSGEGFGITIIEAMACEVPIIITDYTTTKEIVTDNNAGYGIKLLGEDTPLYPRGRKAHQPNRRRLGR